ncbi:phenylalanine--tRNA ligase subunit alpha [Candidatus Micrarchaeota archaeon CG08_land_8_20_14_0_20_59_11]|nr:MAG: phenylalanine--tRNA ligase subunit alpha [Candidatus Micrarchaeota archaeon CG08_land_8_20_14_0_20_59_11]
MGAWNCLKGSAANPDIMNDNERAVLKVLARKPLEGREIGKASGVSYSAVMSALAALEAEGFVKTRREEKTRFVLTPEGEAYARKGTPERRLADAVPKDAVLDDAVAKAGLTEAEKGIALQWAKRNGWIDISKRGDRTTIIKKACAESSVEKALKKAPALGATEARELLARGLASEKAEKTVFAEITLAGEKALLGAGREESRLTPQMLKDGSWERTKFKEYDVRTMFSEGTFIGTKQPYREFLNQIKLKLVGMGFKEDHGPLVELEFWNMDALFMAQDHPAREIHDVFVVEDPARGEILDKTLLKKVQQAHEKGLAGSKGWRYKWDPEVAARLVMRSQTTSVSARHLARKITPPVRMFCIGRVFRPDKIDWKHFIEFNQCEGIVADGNMTFRELLGYLRDFAVEVFGAEDVRFVPGYFPFTEPSVELYAKIPGRGWVEVGGAGMFRPEMLEAFGIDVPVLAWGLGIDRLAMIKLEAKDIRDLFTHDLEKLR